MSIGMISKAQLTAVYRDTYFVEDTGDLVITERGVTNKGNDLERVTINGLTGKYLQILPNWLKDTSEPYQKLWHDCPLLRRDCDSVLLLQHNGVEYVMWIELKSGYSSATSDAMFQIVGSSIRAKSYLNTFAEYRQSEREEVGLIVSHPLQTNDVSMENGNEDVMANKRGFVPGALSKKEILIRNYRRELKANKGNAVLKSEDFSLGNLPLDRSCKFERLPLIHVTLDGVEGELDIDDVLARLQQLKSM